MIKYVIQIPFQDWTNYENPYIEVVCDTEQETNKIIKTIIDDNFFYNGNRVEGTLCVIMRNIDTKTFYVEDKILHQIKCFGRGKIVNTEGEFIEINPSIKDAKNQLKEQLEYINNLIKKGDLTINDDNYIQEIIYHVALLDNAYNYYKEKIIEYEKYKKAKWWE